MRQTKRRRAVYRQKRDRKRDPAGDRPTRRLGKARGDGSLDVVRRGVPRGLFEDLYHFFLTTRWSTLLSIFFFVYVALGALFAGLYLAGGDCIQNARSGSYVDAFFFSVQTMSTIGYGQMAPRGLYANALVTIEAFLGLLAVALQTGLVFAKFSRPTARVIFSSSAVISVGEGGAPVLMVRMANARGNQIYDASLHVSVLAEELQPDGSVMRRFRDLKLQRQRAPIFTLTWTAIHDIDEQSPLHGRSREDLERVNARVLVAIAGTDETFANSVHARRFYAPDEIVWNARFADVLSRADDGRVRIDFERFHTLEPLPDPPANTVLPQRSAIERA